MKKNLFFIILLPVIGLSQVKKSHLFVEGGYSTYSESSKNSSVTSSFGAPVFALTYNYAPKGKLGFGVSVEAGSIKSENSQGYSVNDMTIATLADFRYYITSGKNTFIPLLQIGYNLYNYGSTYRAGTYTTKVEMKNAGQGAVGIGYSYALWKHSGIGPYAALKLSYQNYTVSTTTNVPAAHPGNDNLSLTGGIATIGFRF